MTREQLIRENAAQKQQIENLKFDLESKDSIIAKLQKMLFGATSEKQKKKEEFSANQIDLFTPY